MNEPHVPEAIARNGAPETKPRADDGSPEAWHLPPPGLHTTGTQLRRRLVTRESIAELEAQAPRSPLRRIFDGMLRRK
ncbi:MAG: hypothetical protein K0R64_8 [Novosphingobium lindaniclasticum]|jgi:hypothetical protein|uniref:hypothetical protein n=1 Tax=Novosphingobium lindaniclasticum TaxID=1329895 RepID=UPI002409AF58|nr:hypothetical protein [Novosphingobium lindaniclasticum]MDF2637024.1 hypothetical protein [Novosphingobium lindaniclasticum]